MRLQIIAYETGPHPHGRPARWIVLCRGLTDAAERQMRAIIDEIMQVGVSRAIESGPQQRLMRSALQEEQRIAQVRKLLLG